MTRRQACGLIVIALLVVGGRLVRHHLLLGPGGTWREPSFLDSLLPPIPEKPSDISRPQLPLVPLAVNTCPAESLTALPGVGPVLAGRIVAARGAGVHFARPADLEQIKGIGPKLAGRIAPYLNFRPQTADSSTSKDPAETAIRRRP